MDVENRNDQLIALLILKLDTVSLLEILRKLPPTTVLSLCKTSVHFAKICKNKQIFEALMNTHYPEYPIDYENPKKQYIDITNEKGIRYFIRTNPFLDDVIVDSNNEEKYLKHRFESVAFANYTNRDIDDAINFTIFGTKIKTGQTLWIHTLEKTQVLFDRIERRLGELSFDVLEVNILSTKEDAIKSVIDSLLVNDNDSNDESTDDESNDDNESFKSYVEKNLFFTEHHILPERNRIHQIFEFEIGGIFDPYN